MDKEYYMRQALKQAERAAAAGEVPVGAVVVMDGKIIARAHNLKEKKNCANYHAEMIAIERAAKKLNNWYLDRCELYVTLEPCAMCCGAIINARLKEIYFGAWDTKAGCVDTLYQLLSDNRFNCTVPYEGGILKEECANVLSDFFKNRRRQKKEV